MIWYVIGCFISYLLLKMLVPENPGMLLAVPFWPVALGMAICGLTGCVLCYLHRLLPSFLRKQGHYDFADKE